MRVYNLTRIEVTDCNDLIKELIKIKKQKVSRLSYDMSRSNAQNKAIFAELISFIKEEIAEYENYEIKVVNSTLKVDESEYQSVPMA